MPTASMSRAETRRSLIIRAIQGPERLAHKRDDPSDHTAA